MNNPPGWQPNPYQGPNQAPPGGQYGAPNYMGGPPMQPYGMPGYGMPAYQSTQPSGTAVAALVLSIMSWVATGCLTGIPAFFLARSELNAIERGASSPAGKGMAQAAYWIALVNLVLTVLVVMLFAVLFAAGSMR